MGCKNACGYCYAFCNSKRFRYGTWEKWIHPDTSDIKQRTDKAINRFKSKDSTSFMFPSTHDIREEYLVYVTHLIYWFNEINFWKNADKKNHLLIVSKPRKYCIEKILEQLGFDEKETNPSVKKDISFLFTIGSSNSEILKQWEGDTPSFEERLECLKMVSGAGYQVGIIIEPILDSRPSDIIKECEPFVTGDIWIGLMNHTSLMDPEFKERYKKSNWFRNLENPNFLKICVEGWLEIGNGKLRLKDSIQKILNVDDRGKIMDYIDILNSFTKFYGTTEKTIKRIIYFHKKRCLM